jgi:hypothetical protein
MAAAAIRIGNAVTTQPAYDLSRESGIGRIAQQFRSIREKLMCRERELPIRGAKDLPRRPTRSIECCEYRKSGWFKRVSQRFLRFGAAMARTAASWPRWVTFSECDGIQGEFIGVVLNAPLSWAMWR